MLSQSLGCIILVRSGIVHFNSIFLQEHIEPDINGTRISETIYSTNAPSQFRLPKEENVEFL